MSSAGYEHDSVAPGARQFLTTHWSAVVAATGTDSSAAGTALAELCQVYWHPLYVFVRRQGYSPHDAEDLTQEFFAKLLAKNYLATVREEKGKFRSFLLIALKRFLANARDRAMAKKRSGQHTVLRIDSGAAESHYQSEPADTLTAEKLFERRWAQTLLDQVLARLHREYEVAGKAALFTQLRGSLGRRRGSVPYSEMATRLNTTEAAIKMSAQRLRSRYRKLLRAEIAKTVTSSEEIDEEIRYLFAVFSS